MGRPVASRPDIKYIGLDLTLIEYIKTSAICTFGIIRRIRDIGDDISNKAIGIEAEIEIDIGG